MLIEFKVSNFLSFKEEIRFSLASSSLKDKKVSDESVLFHPYDNNKFTLLKSAAVYGANASGKSNLVKAMIFFKKFILSSSTSTQIEEPIDVVNFKLSTESEKESSVFDIIFLTQNRQFRYGFSVNPLRVDAEWLYMKELKPKAREKEIFFRTYDGYEVNDIFQIGKDLVEKKMVRSNALLLSTAAQFNEPIATEIFHWLSTFNLVSGNRDGQYSPYTAWKLQDPVAKARILDFTKFADLGIDDIQLVQEAGLETKFKGTNPQSELALTKLLVEKNNNSLFSFHQKFDKDLNEKELVQFLFSQSESEGTMKYFGLAGPIIDTLDNGKILVIDELDSKLHPLLTQKIISLFNSRETNPKNAQLVFTTHDTNLLSAHIFRRDQIWFTQKDRYGASTLYSLAEYILPVRNDASFEKDYLAGKYGAVPSFKNFKKLFNSKTVLNNGK